MRSESSLGPGPVLRLVAIGAAAAVVLAVVSGTFGGGPAHDVLSALALPPLVALALAAWVAYRPLLVPAVLALVLFGAAALVTADVPHVLLASSSHAATVVTAALTFRGARAPIGSARDYLTLTKPRIMSLLLLTGAAGAFVGAGGWPEPGTFAVAMAGLALACGGASALNHVLDADIDRLMGSRTKRRPIAARRVLPERGLEFGLALSALSFVLLASAVNVLTAALALVGNLFYVLVYTRWLKRSTPQNIVIGGAAGAVPPLVGYAAVTGDLGLPALWLFLIVFLWTPPHFWALALLIREQYAAARVPMLPVVRGERETVRQIMLYTVVLVGFTVAAGLWLGPLYTGAAIVLGGAFLWLAMGLRRDAGRRRAALVFHYSLAYLALLFVAAALDPVLL
jgi:protoheme IX farnesyltransferase